MSAPIIAHLFGDYVVQSTWMAQEKTERNLPAAAHALTYAACFLPLTRDPARLAVIGGTHYVIDRWRLAKHIAWAKNQVAPARHRYPHAEHDGTGYRDGPPWLNTWLMIACDNAVHLAVNHAVLGWRRG